MTAAKALAEGAHGRSVIELGGPRDYSPRDVARALSQVTGKNVEARQSPEDAIVPALMGAGLNAHWAELYRQLNHGVNTKAIRWKGGAARAVRGTTEIDVVLRRLTGGA